MTVKEKLIELFEVSRGRCLSGEEISSQLDCTRNAVWKAVKALQEDGYEISAVTGKGYMLAEDADVLSESGIADELGELSEKVRLRVYRTIDSTNTKLKELAAEGAPEGTAVISGEQTKGRGRLGRSFFSPSDTGLYMSILLRPQLTASDAVKITTAAAVAVAEAIESLSGLSPKIKWVNDVYINDKKVCGILTEAAFNMELGGLDYAVLGIGVNAYEPEGGFPEDIKDIAGAVFPSRRRNMRNRLAAKITERFSEYYNELCKSGKTAYIDGYRKRLMWKNESINVISGDNKMPATLMDVDDECRLIVRYPNGTTSAVATGEISIRKVK